MRQTCPSEVPKCFDLPVFFAFNLVASLAKLVAAWAGAVPACGLGQWWDAAVLPTGLSLSFSLPLHLCWFANTMHLAPKQCCFQFLEEEFLPSEGDGALAQAAQGGCGVCFSGDIPAPPGQGPLQPIVGDPAWAGGWTG